MKNHLLFYVLNSYTYWQPIFYVQSIAGDVYDPAFDYQINMTMLNFFLNTYNSSRKTFFGNSLIFDPTNDYLMSNLYLLPCYGQTFAQNFNSIIQSLQALWASYFNSLGNSFWLLTHRKSQLNTLKK